MTSDGRHTYITNVYANNVSVIEVGTGKVNLPPVVQPVDLRTRTLGPFVKSDFS